ncbi:MAG TPA: NAD(P)H-hydrate dehydratase [Ramlibacter sp.]|uniref:NAD(P)H-hydrate dehydratase n=1 Tax=Ramlibacter sp. TaxID=1917967 RepID=UPI002D5FA788|nr:NAD(P)H-hydrate dehydratase [Ramlibacter sp.]HZY18892.1 NAD(P)H-hydrate dehydratase [Ramlibacter sp.]
MPKRIDAQALRDWALPALSDDADKEARGRVLVIAGSREVPGAAVLAGTAALRTGAGKLAIATGASVAAQMAFAMPEARVIALPETAQGGFAPAGVELLERPLRHAGCVLVGPGLMDPEGTRRFMAALLPALRGRAAVLDALAMEAAPEVGRFEEPLLLTPHAGEMAHLTGASKDAVLADPVAAATDAARRWNAVVAVKGPRTVIAAPDGRLWLHEGGNRGLATSGSGDTLAGAIAGLCARGATLEQACAWGVLLHAQAGDRLAERLGPVGYLAREIPQEMLAVLRTLEA